MKLIQYIPIYKTNRCVPGSGEIEEIILYWREVIAEGDVNSLLGAIKEGLI